MIFQFRAKLLGRAFHLALKLRNIEARLISWVSSFTYRGIKCN